MTARTGLEAKFHTEARDRLGPRASEQAIAEAAASARAAFYERLSQAGLAARRRLCCCTCRSCLKNGHCGSYACTRKAGR